MKCDDLVSEYIVSRGDGGWNCDRPRVIVGDEIIARPFSRRRRSVDETSFVNLEELKSVPVSLFAITVALGHVVDDGAVMRLGP